MPLQWLKRSLTQLSKHGALPLTAAPSFSPRERWRWLPLKLQYHEQESRLSEYPVLVVVEVVVLLLLQRNLQPPPPLSCVLLKLYQPLGANLPPLPLLADLGLLNLLVAQKVQSRQLFPEVQRWGHLTAMHRVREDLMWDGPGKRK